MNGVIKTATLAGILLTSSLAQAGWLQDEYYHCVDPCYPWRYGYMAHQEVNAAFVPQVNNGHVLDQTIWNYHFEPGTDHLTPGGMYQLAILGRRRPHPDCRIYLQTAQDIAYNPVAPDAFVKARVELDARRVQAVLRYLQAQTAARPMPWDVTVHDPSEVGISAVPGGAVITQRDGSFRGSLLTPGASGAGAAGGAAAGPRPGY
jgi:hypothetical protein